MTLAFTFVCKRPASLAKAQFDVAGRGSGAGFALYEFVKVALMISVSFGVERIPLSPSLHPEESADERMGLVFFGVVWFFPCFSSERLECPLIFHGG